MAGNFRSERIFVKATISRFAVVLLNSAQENPRELCWRRHHSFIDDVCPIDGQGESMNRREIAFSCPGAAAGGAAACVQPAVAPARLSSNVFARDRAMFGSGEAV